MKKSWWSVIFVLVLMMVSYYYGYHEILFKRPQSVHKWRQSDCASLALNYCQDGMNFFEPETHNLTSDGGTSGKACPSEIPILYYSVAILYKIFGVHEWIFRFLNTFLFFIGLFYLFKLFEYLLDDRFWATGLSILFFTAPVLVFYGNNFLSNSSAFAFSVVGWYYFVRFYFEENKKWFTVSALFFLLAASFKVTALFSFIAIGGLYLFEILGITSFSKNGVLFTKPLQKFLLFAGVFIIIGAWIFYANYYNQKHDCYYFSTTIFPIWKLDKAGITGVIDNVRKVWLAHYFHPSVLIVFTIGLLFILLNFRKNLKWLNFVLVFLLAEIIVYVILQFWTFKDHDYYTIDMYIFPVMLMTAVFYILKTSYRKIFASTYFKILFVVLVVFNVYHAHKIINERYYRGMNNYGVLDDTYTATPFLREMGITANDTVISIPYESHVSLYLMNQKGWTEYTDARFNRGEKIRYNQDSLGIRLSVNRGAKYMIVQTMDQLYQKPYLQSFCTHLAGTYNDMLVFKLKDADENFEINTKTISAKYFCDAENRIGNDFISSDSVVFRNGETQSSEYAFSGIHSVRLSADHRYGMTIDLDDLKPGESFEISVWRKQTGSSTGEIIVSGDDFYFTKSKVVESGKDGWEKIKLELYINKKLAGKRLGAYLYNPSADPVYFDDFRIIRYKSVFDVQI